MELSEIHDYARRLMDAHGPKAIAEAPQKARAFEEQRDAEQAKTWHDIEQVLLLMRGPSTS
jgi:hypothetical protein